MDNPYLPHEAIVVERIDESHDIQTLRLRFTNEQINRSYRFEPGQFNMLYLYGVGEIAISIVSDPKDKQYYEHTIRCVGRVSNGFAKLNVGDRIGVRGPYGKGWPLHGNKNKNIIIITGGLGCAPVVSVINYIFKRRNEFGKLFILHGIKHSHDLIYRKRFKSWAQHPNTEVLLTADSTHRHWPWYQGTTVDLLPRIKINAKNTVAMMCGPEIMMYYAAEALLERNLSAEQIYLSMERNMHCALGHCGHCQYGNFFVCKDGPVFSYQQVRKLFRQQGF